MATWLKVNQPGGYDGLTSSNFFIDIESGFTTGFQRYGSGPYTYNVTFNGTPLEGSYSSVDDALTAAKDLTEGHTLATYLSYS
jgi:hypothetical protein